MDMLPACLKDHMAMLGQRQDLVLVLGACVLSHRALWRQNSASLYASRELLGPGIKAQSLCFSLQSVPCWHHQAEDGQRNIWASHLMAEDPA